MLIAALDAMEADTDREPSLGWTLAGALGDCLDLEAENDDEPSLGWTTAINQTPRQRFHGGGDDLEHEHDGREEDDPPENNGDRERDPAEDGIADREALALVMQEFVGVQALK